MKTNLLPLLFILFGINVKIVAQIGILDPTFDPGTGANVSILTAPVQTDGKIILGGSFTTFNGTSKNRIVRVESDGSIDPTFSIGTGFKNSVNKILIQSDDKLLAAGSFTAYNGTTKYRIARLNTDGTNDATFTAGLGPNNIVYNAALQSDQKIILTGAFTQYAGTVRNRIVRANTNGSIDATFAPSSGANNIIYGVAIQTDGSIVIGGTFTTFNGTSQPRVARITSTGVLDAGFTVGTGATGTGTNTVVRACVLQPDGKVLIGGFFNAYNGTSRNNIARLNTDGTIDLTFTPGTGANSTITSITIQPDGKIIITGAFTMYNGTSRNRIARLNTDGTLDNTFTPGTGTDNTTYTSSLQSDGKLILGGQFSTYNGTSRSCVARLMMSCPTVTLSTGQTNVLCNGGSTGSATVSASGGTSFTYSWSPSGGTAAVTSGLSGGTYTCAVTNECANTSTVEVTIVDPSAITLAPLTNTSVCVGANAVLTATATGGTGAITYTWMPGNLVGANQTVNPASTTSYTVTAEDANGCSTSDSQTTTVTSCPGPVLLPGSCGVTIATLDQTLNFSAAAGATNYKLEITNAQQPFNVVNVRGNNQTTFKMSWVSGIQYERTYNIRISAFIAGVWRPYGNTCTVTTPAIANIPTTQFSAGSCNVTLATLDQQLNFTTVTGATNYRFEIINAAQPFSVVNVKNNTVLNFKMSWVSGIQYNRTYDVRIGAYVNGAWQPYGTMCQITTPATIPTTQLVPAACGATVATRSQVVNFSPVSGASHYRIEVVSATQPLNAVKVKNNTQTTFALSYVANTQANRTYDIRVAAYVGGVWGAYGAMCQLTAAAARSSDEETNEASKNSSLNNIGDEELSFNIFPNPNNGNFEIDLQQDTHIIIYNTIGEIILDNQFPSGKNPVNIEDQKPGMYFVKIITNNNKQQSIKIIKN